MQAFRKLPGLKKVERFKSWLFSIAINRVRDFSRKKRFRVLFKMSGGNDEIKTAEPQINDNPEPINELIGRISGNKLA